MHDQKLIMVLGMFVSNFAVSNTKANSFTQIHPAMVELFDAMRKRNDSIGDVNKISAIPGNVKSEDPCRIHFKLPKIHHLTNILKIDLHIKVIFNNYMSMITLSLDFRYD
jgi:hypothetical protein